MAEHTIKMPDVGEGVVEAEIVTWHVKVGDVIEEDQDVVDVMTDKATVEIPSPVSGKVVRLTGDAGDMIPVGSEILVIETDGDAASSETVNTAEQTAADDSKTKDESSSKATGPTRSAEQTTVPTETTPAPAKRSAPTPAASGTKALASPAVRQRALELDIELSTVPGSGPAGRILRQDLDDFVAAGGRMASKSGPSSAVLKKQTGQTERKIIGLRRKIARNMEAAWATPLITYVEEIDVTEIESLRQHLNAQRADEQPKLTLIPFLGRALIRALADIPQANAHYFPDEDRLIEFDGVHLGIATATDNGLVVPVLHHAEAMDIWEMAGTLADLSKQARDGKASRENLTGSTITITSLGAIGGLVTTPILNPPETSIIGVNKISERAVLDGAGRVTPRKFMNLSSSFDHRIVDGYDAAMLIQKVRQLLEHPATLFM
ncbi:MAG: branched-chain alpha-keto acid dehydrogenase subunit E2 [Ponticaulis sp.]|nr:branched-chain alpha-keto acid dehydrogenase subunit E2 [Ponticaulis sp.]|tara:strand:+ start:88401 stop:89705 length:1305 start_codon:yes stop_codon:yes gene_type:complete